MRLVVSRRPHDVEANDITSSSIDSRTAEQNLPKGVDIRKGQLHAKSRHAVRWAGARRPRVAAADAAGAAVEAEDAAEARTAAVDVSDGEAAQVRRPPAAVGSMVPMTVVTTSR